jgi:transposase-like protein
LRFGCPGILVSSRPPRQLGKRYRVEHAGEEPALELSERAELQELRRRVREQEMELAFLKKTAAYFARERR